MCVGVFNFDRNQSHQLTSLLCIYYAHLITGNTIGALAGILGPIIVAWCTETWPENGEGWRVAFFITFLLSCASLVLWFAMVKAEILPALNNPASD